jgi:F-type H+-transporting ATPase subunit b
MRKKTILALLAAALLVAGVAFAQHTAEHAVEPTEHATAEHHEGGGEHGAPNPINWTEWGNKEQPPLLAQVFNFAVLLGIFFYFGRKPVMEGLKARRDSVAKEIEEAQRMKKEADERAKMYQAKLAHLEEELATTKAALVEAGKGERDRIIKEAEEKAERMVRDATELLQQETKQMRQDLVKETIEIAMQAAEEMLKQKITSVDHERLAEEYLAGLKRPTSRPS